MRIRGLLLCAFIVASAIAPAKAEMRISEDRGGQIGRYLQAFAMLRSSGERVVVDGNCLSACTLLLGVVPREKICATPRARFGFHAAWMPNEDGRPVTSRLGTQALWEVYPSSVRHWINSHGGLTRRMIFLEGTHLNGIVPSCTPAHRAIDARSGQRYRSTAASYESARASSYRH
jgi:hypothetical protein